MTAGPCESADTLAVERVVLAPAKRRVLRATVAAVARTPLICPLFSTYRSKRHFRSGIVSQSLSAQAGCRSIAATKTKFLGSEIFTVRRDAPHLSGIAHYLRLETLYARAHRTVSRSALCRNAERMK